MSGTWRPNLDGTFRTKYTMKEKNIRTIAGIGLFAVDATLGLAFYLSLGTGWIAWIIGAVLLVGTEGAKVLTWRLGGAYRILSVALALITLTSITGSVYSTIQAKVATSETARLQGIYASSEYQAVQGEVEMLTTQEETLLARLGGLPADYVSAGAKVIDEVASIRSQKAEAVSLISSMEQNAKAGATTDAPTIFTALGKLVGKTESDTRLFLIMLLAVLVESSAFALIPKALPEPNATGERVRQTVPTGHVPTAEVVVKKAKDVATRTSASQRDVDASRYLNEALNHPRAPYLKGRGLVASTLALTDRQARNLLAELLRERRVVRDGKFFRAVGHP